MRNHKFVTGCYYHIYNRGVDKRRIFSDHKDIQRFLLSMDLFNYQKPLISIRSSFYLNSGVKHLNNGSSIDNKRLVSFVAYSVLPNHFHFILKQEIDGGISEFMKRLGGGYTNYFNERNKRSGSLFQGTFKSKYIEEDNYFRLLISYVMCNNLIHKIPINKNNLFISSMEEYKTQKFSLINKKEAENVLKIYQNYNSLLESSKEVIQIILQNRRSFDFNED